MTVTGRHGDDSQGVTVQFDGELGCWCSAVLCIQEVFFSVFLLSLHLSVSVTV